MTSVDTLGFHGKFILFYVIKNLKFKFYYKNVDLWKKIWILIIKRINEGEIEEDNIYPNTPGYHIKADGLSNVGML